MSREQPAVLIAGPTASGKSARAIALAERLGGVVINADSMQVYADLRILTARPSPADEARVPHALYGHVDGAENYSVGRWLADASRAIADARENGRVPILVGGTGLYFKALTQGLSAIPPVPDDVRRQVRTEAAGLAPDALHARLRACDPETAARLRPSDPQRILRALEVWASTGAPLARFQASREAPLLAPGTWTGVFVAPDRAVLQDSIDRRFDAMMVSGALDEVRPLAARRLDPTLPVMRAHGVPHLLRYLEGALERADAIAGGQRDTRAYMKRQFTFARHQLPGWRWITPDEPVTDAG